ncbi:sirtuin 2, partial [Tanacetum coccineum]
MVYCTKFEDVCPLPKAPIGTPQGGGLLVAFSNAREGTDAIHPAGKYCKLHGKPLALSFRGSIKYMLMVCQISAPGTSLEGDQIVALTGARISTECGIPDYRSMAKDMMIHGEKSAFMHGVIESSIVIIFLDLLGQRLYDN